MNPTVDILQNASWLSDFWQTKPAKIIVLALVFFVLFLVVRLVFRMFYRAIRSRSGGESAAERRAKTLGSVASNAINAVLGTLFLLSVLDVMGVSVGPLLAGASILGMVLGFGAQALVKDVLSGIFMLIEDQYGVGDIINIDNANVGTVERMTLRITMLRDSEGRAHYIPNGTISRVVVLSKDFARAMVDFEVGLDYDADKVAALLRDIGAEMQRDMPEILLEPTDVKGIETIGPSCYTIRTLTKCARACQWDVAREYRRRVLARFRQVGIKTPAQTVVVKTGD